jgi:hypothetical protein
MAPLDEEWTSASVAALVRFRFALRAKCFTGHANAEIGPPIRPAVAGDAVCDRKHPSDESAR